MTQPITSDDRARVHYIVADLQLGNVIVIGEFLRALARSPKLSGCQGRDQARAASWQT